MIDGLPLVKRQMLAKFFGVSSRTVDNWVERGCPVAERFLKSRNVRGFSIEDVFNWRCEENRFPRGLEESYECMVKLELNTLGKEVAERTPRMLASLAEENDHSRDPEAVEYGAKFAIFMLVSVINARTEDETIYFDPYPALNGGATDD